MNTSPSAIVWLVGWAFYLFGIYTRHARRFRQQTVLQQKTQPLDVILDMLTFVGWQIMPLIWIFAGWFDFADYSLPIGLGFVGTAGFVLALFLLWKAYAALGDNWSPKMDVRENQQLVTEGPFAHIRHPIYAGFWLWAACQPLLIQNWIAGWVFLILFGLIYFTRVDREEQMLEEAFGEQYRDYARKTPRLFPNPSDQVE